MDLNLQNLALFLRVSELGKIGRAGEEFGYSSTSASQRIHQLESDIGVSLFHRSTRSVTLTYDGEVFLQHAKRILDDVEEARIAFNSDGQNIEGKLRITVSASYGRLYIIPCIPELISRYPGLDIEIDCNDGVVDLIEHGYDVGIRIGDLQSSGQGLLARRLSDSPFYPVASPDYLKKHGTPQVPNDLQQHVCISFKNHNEWKLKNDVGKGYSVPVTGPVSLNWGDAIADLVEAGVGIGLASSWHAGPSLKAGRLVRVLPEFTLSPEVKIWALRPQGRLMPIRVKVFLDYIEKKIEATNKERYGDLISFEKKSRRSRPIQRITE